MIKHNSLTNTPVKITYTIQRDITRLGRTLHLFVPSGRARERRTITDSCGGPARIYGLEDSTKSLGWRAPAPPALLSRCCQMRTLSSPRGDVLAAPFESARSGRLASLRLRAR
jgi:hypothetical protein